MLKKIDWYILKKFLTTFVFAILLLSVITVVVDISEKSDDFIKSGLPASQIITKYYFGFLPRIVAMLFPLFVFISVIFFTSKMAGRSEIIAILASGTSFRRMLYPYFLGAAILAGCLWLSYRYLIPKANAIYSVFQTKYIDAGNSYSPFGTTNTIYFKNDTIRYGQVSYYDTASKRGSNFVIQKIQHNKLTYNLRAETLQWDTAKRKWKLFSATERIVDSGGERLKQYDTMFIDLNFKPSEIKKDEYTKDKLSTPELTDFIQKEELRGQEGINDLKVERYKRDATPVAVFILTLMGVSVSSRKVRGGSGFHMALGFIIAALFVMTDRFSTIFSTKGNLSPLIAAWIPNVIFLAVALYLYRRAPK